MAKTPTASTRLERIHAAREKLEARIAAKHPDSKAYRARLAEYDESEARLKEAAAKAKKG